MWASPPGSNKVYNGGTQIVYIMFQVKVIKKLTALHWVIAIALYLRVTMATV